MNTVAYKWKGFTGGMCRGLLAAIRLLLPIAEEASGNTTSSEDAPGRTFSTEAEAPRRTPSAEAAAIRRTPSAEAVESRAERYFQDYGNAILRLAYAYVRNMADAEDILQETLIRVLDACPHFENDRHEKAYLMKTAANLAKNKIAYNKRHETDELAEDLAAEEREDLSYIWEAVGTLPEVQRAAIHLFYQEGYRTGEIAAILGRKESTVRSDLKRARESLKGILKEVWFE